MGNIILTKESGESEIKAYFNAVLKLAESWEEFPVNLDEVWPLVYGRKEEAVRALTSCKQFIEGIDYQVLRKNAGNLQGGRPTEDYFLAVPCMEFFIARKVRPVFEVYRQVFHKAAEQIRISTQPAAPKLSEQLMWVREVKKLLNLNDASTLAMLQKISTPALPLPDYTPSKGILKSATELLKERGLKTTAKDFNLCALDLGYLCEQQRKSSSGGVKTFKAVTEKGRPYGENQVSPKNPKETQPLWYADKFGELLYRLGIEGTDKNKKED